MERDNEKIVSVFDNSTDFLNVGIEILFRKNGDVRYAKVAILSIQTAIELLAKYRLAYDGGLDAIRLKTKNTDKFKTINYWDVIKKIGKEYHELGDYEKEIFLEMAELRNNLIHFSGDINPECLKDTCMALLCAAFPVFSMGEKRDEHEMKDYRWFLTEENYNFLINNATYRAEALDNAYASSYNLSIVERCYNCHCESFSLRDSDVYFCHCCGFTIDKEIIDFCECSICHQRHVAYDTLNEQSGIEFEGFRSYGGLFYGRCISCDEVQWVSCCPECENTSARSGLRPEKPYYPCGCLPMK